MEITENDALKVIRDVLSNNSDKNFWDWADSKPEEYERVFLDLICGTHWRNTVEVYEYLSYIVSNTYLSIKKFREEKVSIKFWASVLRYQYNKCLNMLDDTNSMEYKVLGNYFPLTDALKKCNEELSKLNALLTLNRQTEGTIYNEVRDLYKSLYDRMTTNFMDIIKGNDYVSDKEAMVIYKTLVLNGLSDVISFENMNSLQSLTTPCQLNEKLPGIKGKPPIVMNFPNEKEIMDRVMKNKDKLANDIMPEIKEEVKPSVIEITPVKETPVTDITKEAEIVKEVTIENENKPDIWSKVKEHIEETPEIETISENISSETEIINTEQSDNISEPEEIKTEPVEEELEKQRQEELQKELELREQLRREKEKKQKKEEPKPSLRKNINLKEIEDLTEKEPFNLEKFIDKFQELETMYYVSKKNKNEDDVTFFINLLGNIFERYELEYRKIIEIEEDCKANPKFHKHTLIPFDKWHDTAKHIECFKNKTLTN